MRFLLLICLLARLGQDRKPGINSEINMKIIHCRFVIEFDCPHLIFRSGLDIGFSGLGSLMKLEKMVCFHGLHHLVVFLLPQELRFVSKSVAMLTLLFLV